MKNKNKMSIESYIKPFLDLTNKHKCKKVEWTILIIINDKLKDFCGSNRITKGNYVFKPNKSMLGHLSRWYVWWIVDKASERASIYKMSKKRELKGAWPHLFRHGNAMFLLEHTEDIDVVRQQLGHSNVKTTQSYAYTKRPKIKRVIAEVEW